MSELKSKEITQSKFNWQQNVLVLRTNFYDIGHE